MGNYVVKVMKFIYEAASNIPNFFPAANAKRTAPKGKTQPLKRRCGLPPVRQLSLPSETASPTDPLTAPPNAPPTATPTVSDTAPATVAPGAIKVNVATPKEKKTIDTREDATIEDLKEAVSIAFKDKNKVIPVSKICLVYAGKILGDNHTLNSLGITDGKTVHLIISRRVLDTSAGQVIEVGANFKRFIINNAIYTKFAEC